MDLDIDVNFKKNISTYYTDEREYTCLECGSELNPYSFGLGTDCRCKNCGYKDPCCE